MYTMVHLRLGVFHFPCGQYVQCSRSYMVRTESEEAFKAALLVAEYLAQSEAISSYRGGDCHIYVWCCLLLQRPGEEKTTNYALKAGNKKEFIKAVTEGLDEAPEYFAINAQINKEGYESLDDVLKKGLQQLFCIWQIVWRREKMPDTYWP